jgi:hypothetical protein
MRTKVDIAVVMIANVIRDLVQLAPSEELVVPHVTACLRRDAKVLPGLMPPDIYDHPRSLQARAMIRPR